MIVDLKTLADQVLRKRIRSIIPAKKQSENLVHFGVNKKYSREQKNMPNLTVPKNEQVREQKMNTGNDQESQKLIQWFLNTKELPSEPFMLKQAVFVTYPEKFYQSLKTQIENGPNEPRARTGALQDDLRCLFKRKDNGDT